MRHFFGFIRVPFPPDIRMDELYHTAALEGAKERFLYAVNLGAISVITCNVGSGKLTALRYASNALHPSQSHHPIIAFRYILLRLLHCLVCASFWSESVTIRGECGIKKRREYLKNGLLDESVECNGHP